MQTTNERPRAAADGYTYSDPFTASPVAVPARKFQLEEDANSEYMQLLRDQTKTEIKSITGRMFEVLNEYEDATTRDSTYMKDYISDLNVQLQHLDDLSVKANIQLLITDYKELCSERESLLYSLQEWFEQKHVEEDEIMPDIHSRRASARRQQTLLEGRRASEKLKEVQELMEDAASKGEDLALYKQQKQRLESDLVESKLTIDKLEKEADDDDDGDTTDIDRDAVFISNTWRHAAVDIRNMLRLVRDSGLNNIQDLEEKLHDMTDTLKAQEERIAAFNQEQFEYRKKVQISEDLACELRSENEFLRDEVDRIRGDLYDSRKKMAAMERQHVKKQQEIAKSTENTTNEFEQQITSLTKENATLKSELASLKVVLDSYMYCAKPKKGSTRPGKKSGERSPSLRNNIGISEITKQMNIAQAKGEDAVSSSNTILNQILQEKDIELEKLQDELSKQIGTSEDATKRLSIVSEENKALKERIAELQSVIAATTSATYGKLFDSSVPSTGHNKLGNHDHNVTRATHPHGGLEQSSVNSSSKGNIPSSHKQHNETGDKLGNQSNVLQNGNQFSQNEIEYLDSLQNKSQSLQNRSQSPQIENRSQSPQSENRSFQCSDQFVQNENESFQIESQSPQIDKLFVMVQQQPVQDAPVGMKYIEQASIEEIELSDSCGNDYQRSGATTVINGTLHNTATHTISVPPTMHEHFSLPTPSPAMHSSVFDGSTNQLLNSADQQFIPPVLEFKRRNTSETALDIVVDLMDQLNSGGQVQHYGQRDSVAMQNIQTEMEKVVDYIQSFMKNSLNLVDNEVESMNMATNHLFGNLTECEKFEAERKVYQAVQDQDVDHKHLRERVMKFGQDAIKVLRAGEEVVQSHVQTQQRKFSSVASVLAEHKSRQPKSFKFSLPKNTESLFVEAHGTTTPTGATPGPTGATPGLTGVTPGPTGASNPPMHSSLFTTHQAQSNNPLSVRGSDMETSTTQCSSTANRIRAIMMMAEGRPGNELLTINGALDGTKGLNRSDELGLQITNVASKKKVAPMLPRKRHSSRKSHHQNGTDVSAVGKERYNPFKSSTPTWGFLKTKPQNGSCTNNTSASAGTNRRGYDNKMPPSSQATEGTTKVFLDINGRGSTANSSCNNREQPMKGGTWRLQN